MTIDLYSAFFDHAVFPVFALSDQGKIIYKNPSANKYLPMLRKNACVLKHFYPAEMPEESCVLRILGDTPYHIALALKDDNAFLALAFSRFQYEDGVPIACSLLSHYGSTASDFFCFDLERESELYNLINDEYLTLWEESASALDWHAFSQALAQYKASDLLESEKLELLMNACRKPTIE